MLTKDEATARVAKGAAHLDQLRPGWFRDVDTGTLTLSSCQQCVLGQLYGSDAEQSTSGYYQALDAFKWNPWELGEAAPFVVEGFSLPLRENPTLADIDTRNPDWLALQDAWIAEIAARTFPTVEARDNGRSLTHERQTR